MNRRRPPHVLAPGDPGAPPRGEARPGPGPIVGPSRPGHYTPDMAGSDGPFTGAPFTGASDGSGAEAAPRRRQAAAVDDAHEGLHGAETVHY